MPCLHIFVLCLDSIISYSRLFIPNIFLPINNISSKQQSPFLIITFHPFSHSSYNNIQKHYIRKQKTTNKMKDIAQSRTLQQTKSQQKTQYTQSTVLHRGAKYISNRGDPQFAVTFSIPQQDVIELFEEIATHLGFQLIQVEESYATAIKRSPKATFFDLLNCLSWWGQSNQVKAVKITILNNPKSLQSKDKLCRIKALSQPTPQVLQFIETFKQKIQKIKGVVTSKYMFESTSYSEQPSYQNNSNPFHLQACAHYMFHKILTNSTGQQLKIKQKLERSLKQFLEAFQNIQQSSSTLPTPLLNVIGIVKEVCEEISRKLVGKDNVEYMATLMPYIKISVEKYIFDRTQQLLKSMYIHRDKQISEKFNKKRNKIITQMNKDQIFQQVLINKNIRNIQQGTKASPSRGGIVFCQRACPELQKIMTASSPREKLKHCNLMYAQLKSYFFTSLNMKYQLSSMEDIIPVFIVVVLFTEIPDMRSQFNLMLDYINGTQQEFQAQKRLVMNLSESLNYVVRDWEVQI